LITNERSIELIQETVQGLRRAGLLDNNLLVDDSTVLLGVGSELDSVAFVTLVSDLEERLSRETGTELFLVLDDLHEFNSDNPSLTVRTLAPYLVELTGGL
jgi:acyl carrier protein